MAKKIRREARKAQEKLVPDFKRFVNTQLGLGERLVLAWRMIIKRF